MAVVKSTDSDIDQLARLLRAEAESEGDLGMLMVGNVVINRALANCLDFKNLRTIPDVIYQSPGGFEAVQFGYFYQRPRERERRLARRVVNGERFYPATNSLWYFRPEANCPDQWFNQDLTGRYKKHCFFTPTYDDCPNVF
ncbi:cell wall hydrolase [Gorillibacterium massiliense]|uniref:cell wall hydrolase n=1 Tax=Gorillibacterium massiliense TaxID=1280390 RepID=UPI000592BF37|nr:cell wall hydrolase [Gorillibacterium massiliense]